MSNKNYAKTAIGVTSFKKLVKESTIFVDKSLLIKEFVENSGRSIISYLSKKMG